MTTVREVYEALFAFAPEYMKEDWDNVGLLCGHMDAAVSRVLVALDPADWVLQEAKQRGAQLIVTHHPLIFSPVKSVSDQTDVGRKLLYLIENGIACINAHTNLDCAPGGVNDCLAAALGLKEIRVIDPSGVDASGREWGRKRRKPSKRSCTGGKIPPRRRKTGRGILPRPPPAPCKTGPGS